MKITDEILSKIKFGDKVILTSEFKSKHDDFDWHQNNDTIIIAANKSYVVLSCMYKNGNEIYPPHGRLAIEIIFQ